MTGGGGADTFHASPGGGVDRILDFNTAQGDHVILDGVSPGTAVIAQRGSDTVIDLGHGDQIILLGVNQATLPQGWLIGA
jgi:Ca2+-binding RTX toxin-like protein